MPEMVALAKVFEERLRDSLSDIRLSLKRALKEEFGDSVEVDFERQTHPVRLLSGEFEGVEYRYVFYAQVRDCRWYLRWKTHREWLLTVEWKELGFGCRTLKVFGDENSTFFPHWAVDTMRHQLAAYPYLAELF